MSHAGLSPQMQGLFEIERLDSPVIEPVAFLIGPQVDGIGPDSMLDLRYNAFRLD